jgi:sugar O-acyltransferase (sialic acid O-acetyltransferase NeuD family)
MAPADPPAGVAILGAGGMGREVYWYLTAFGAGPLVFVDDVSGIRSVRMGTVDVAVIADWDFSARVGRPEVRHFVIGVGDPAAKRKMVERAIRAGLEPIETIVHPRACLAAGDSVLGVGGVLCPGVIVSTNVRIGDYVICNWNTSIGHDAVIGDFATVNPGVCVSGNVQLGEDVYLGAGSVVRERIRIARGVVVGAAACVVKDIDEPDTVVVGVPARKMG